MLSSQEARSILGRGGVGSSVNGNKCFMVDTERREEAADAGDIGLFKFDASLLDRYFFEGFDYSWRRHGIERRSEINAM